MNELRRPVSGAVADSILWDVVDEQFSEAEFLLEQWERAVRSPAFTLHDLRTTIEPRLAAHLDGLVIGGDAVAARVLFPELRNADAPDRATVAALALLCSGTDDAVRWVLQAVDDTEGELQRGLARAVVLSESPRLHHRLVTRFQESPAEAGTAVWLEIMAGRSTDPGVSMDRPLRSEDPRVVAAALQVLSRFARREHVALVHHHLRSLDGTVRRHAVKAGLLLHSREAWASCRELVATCPDAHIDLLSTFAMLGGRDDHRVLIARLSQPARIEHVLWTLGFCGTVEAGDVCLAHLWQGDERSSKAAAETLSWIGGFPLVEADGAAAEPSEKETLPPFEDDDLDADLGLDGIDDLPIPDCDEVTRCWEKHRDRPGSNSRHLCGLTASGPALLRALQEAPMWRRHGVAFELSVRTEGTQHVSTDAFSSRQRRQLAEREAMTPGARGASHVDVG